MCHNVIDVREPLIKIATADTVITARLPLTLTFVVHAYKCTAAGRSPVRRAVPAATHLLPGGGWTGQRFR